MACLTLEIPHNSGPKHGKIISPFPKESTSLIRNGNNLSFGCEDNFFGRPCIHNIMIFTPDIISEQKNILESPPPPRLELLLKFHFLRFFSLFLILWALLHSFLFLNLREREKLLLLQVTFFRWESAGNRKPHWTSAAPWVILSSSFTFKFLEDKTVFFFLLEKKKEERERKETHFPWVLSAKTNTSLYMFVSNVHYLYRRTKAMYFCIIMGY
uniref:Uncharacterized protein n=1 Tax=Cacopsylla melanoneura TaxID=428564 RepID=A0A8D8QWT1_9HEMI